MRDQYGMKERESQTRREKEKEEQRGRKKGKEKAKLEGTISSREIFFFDGCAQLFKEERRRTIYE